MTSLDAHLEAIQAMINQPTNRANAEEKIRALFLTVGREELRIFEPEFRKVIGDFLPKRRKALDAELTRLLADIPVTPPPVSAPVEKPAIELEKLRARMRGGLAQLSQRHIFHWSTAYRAYLFEEFAAIAALARDWYGPDVVASTVRQEIAAHTTEIFNKGFERSVGDLHLPPAQAVARQLSGLQRLLGLVVEIYTTRLAQNIDPPIALRTLVSAMLRGIISGFAVCDFGDDKGAHALSVQPQWWAHQIGFLISSDLREISAIVDDVGFKDGLESVGVPFADVVDGLVANGRGTSALPVISGFVADSRRLEVTFRPATLNSERFIDVHCYLDSNSVTLEALKFSAGRGIALVVARVRPDLHEWVTSNRTLRAVLVHITGDSADRARTRSRLLEIVTDALAVRDSPRKIDEPLRLNIAANFPIYQGLLPPPYVVSRSSVRELLRTLERRNGIRVWCSVRRSGKTTASFDLKSTQLSTVVSQTCTRAQRPEQDSVFFKIVTDALASRQRLTDRFLVDAIAECAPARTAGEMRYVFILDEYERLFLDLDLHANADNAVRLRVVLPLLDQMAAFARDNLLVLLGQQPSAHAILMENNPFSPYVVQDPFPLFRHEKGNLRSEFVELLKKVLVEPASFDASFADALYDETAGHPWLTIKLCIAFVDWLIKEERRMTQLSFTDTDFYDFAPHGLSRDAISRSGDYTFFGDAVRDALSSKTRTRAPWEFAVYSVLARLAQETWPHLSCSLSDFKTLVDDVLPPDMNFPSDSLLMTAERANFLDVSLDQVRPRIKLLARVAAVTTRDFQQAGL